jgi:hypothetical protein
MAPLFFGGIDAYAHNAYGCFMTARELIRHKGDIPLGTLKAIERQTQIELT